MDIIRHGKSRRLAMSNFAESLALQEIPRVLLEQVSGRQGVFEDEAVSAYSCKT